MKLKFEELVKIYRGERSLAVEVCGLKRELAICRVDDSTWIASNHPLALGRDIEFTERVGGGLYERIKGFSPDYIITAESKSLPLAYEISKRLGLREMIVARKGVKAYMGSSYLEVQVKSITTAEPQKLILELGQAEKMEGRRLAIVDDVVSTGGTISGLEELVRRAGGTVACRAAVWLEGPWCADEDIIFLGTLPIFVTEEKYKVLLEWWRRRYDR